MHFDVLNSKMQEFGLTKTIDLLENLPIYVKKVTCYSVSVMALSSGAVDLGPLNREILRPTVSLSPNSCILNSAHQNTQISIPPFSALKRYVGAPGQAL